ncbi:GAF domain-containing protein [Fluviicola taffensis]|uniref:GAF domain-containing protein n=1 Tax=Fluviicola taffensis (strain DSM 16823 / NCIMB 13979 / RW262) TaxID=755732 RepID=F2IBC9_FLUTR|nr:GAF domain-containing protein [Fluviicola taffensis]AEA43215.1 GAF domain-containing protein [Fluviicola taffensis DSM 16823]
MAEELFIAQTTKEEKYQVLIPQAKALCEGEPNLVANIANVASALKMTFDFFWVGFYLVEKNELVLGPFQGPIACTRIAWGKGVCGSAWKQNETLVVPDVDAFPGHIACSSESKSEIVVPIQKNGQVVAILDVDSAVLNDFDEIDSKYLNELCEWLGTHCF